MTLSIDYSDGFSPDRIAIGTCPEHFRPGHESVGFHDHNRKLSCLTHHQYKNVIRFYSLPIYPEVSNRSPVLLVRLTMDRQPASCPVGAWLLLPRSDPPPVFRLLPRPRSSPSRLGSFARGDSSLGARPGFQLALLIPESFAGILRSSS